MKRRATLFLILIGMGLFAMLVVLILLMTPRSSFNHARHRPSRRHHLRNGPRESTEHGKAVALAWALRQGYSFAQIRAARRCVK
jgi:hypothetical protein